MTHDGSSCLTEHALNLLISGDAMGEEADGALRHIDLCRVCGDMFERLARGSARSLAELRAMASRSVSGCISVDPVWVPPAQIDEFRVVRRLGRGGMGDVWLARDTLLERDVALKFATGTASDEARLRFRMEARAVARLRHPNILAVYHAAELAGRPFLVTELLHGRSLEDAGSLAPDRIIAVGADLACGLAAAHAAGIVHRDVKPANAFLCDNGVAKLLDFGLAQLREANRTVGRGGALAAPGAARSMPPSRADRPFVFSQATTEDAGIAGTPAYMAPETWRGELASRATDMYAMGALLYTLLVGRPPYEGATVEDVRTSVLAGRLPDLAADAAEAPRALIDLVLRCLSLRQDARPSADEVCSALQALRDGGALPIEEDAADPEACPYRGLLSFGFEQKGLFFGREAEIATVLGELRVAPFVLVLGPSGAGKSSLVRAGVLPHVAAGALGGGPWRVATMLPGERPLEQLVQALAPLVGTPEEDALARPEGPNAPNAPNYWAAHRIAEIAGDGRILLLIDQLEEAWTLADAEARAAFFEAVAALLRVGQSVRVVATLRADFLSRLKDFGDLRRQALRAPVVLGPLSSEGLRRAIVEPARRRGVLVEPELAERLVKAAQGAHGILPLLGFALEVLWEQRDRAAGLILAGHLAALGGLEGALAAHAEAVLVRLSPPLRKEARRLLLALVTVERTRARREERDLLESSPEARAALKALVDSRLVVATVGEETTGYELAHEALLAGWPTLRGWLDEELSARRMLDRMERAAEEWERSDRAPEALYEERHLEELDAVQGSRFPARVASFIAESRAAVRRRRLRRAALAFGLPLGLVLLGVTAWGVTLARHHATITGAVARARALDVGAEDTAREADNAREAALALFEKDDLGPAEEAWRKMLRLEEDADRRRRDVGAALETALAFDARDRATRALYADVTLARLLAAERLHRSALVRELRTQLDVFDDGSRAARLRAPAHVRVETEPRGATLTISRFQEDADGRKVDADRSPLDAGALRELEPGSYVILVEAPGRYTTRYPFRVTRAEERSLHIALPRAADVPEGMIYVPAGRALYGSSDDEATRVFLSHQPIHEIDVGAFLIARTEVTVGDYLAFLRALPDEQRKDRLVQAFTLLRDGRIAWDFRGKRFEDGEPFCRAFEGCIDWARLALEYVSREDGEHYAAWLSRTGRLPGARLCTDREWEHAARGADDRRYPNGNREPDANDACTLATFGGDRLLAGPCAVGTHPRSRSPFGVEDMVGNEAEWVSGPADVAQPEQAVVRGIGWDGYGMYLSLPNRGVSDTTTRVSGNGVRICANARQSEREP